MEGSFRNILCLIDLSETSIFIAREAALIAQKFDAQLQLLHLTPAENPRELNDAPFFEHPDLEEEAYYLNIGKLENLKKELNKTYDVSIAFFENRGNFIDIVKNHVNKFSIDLIVMGTRKKTWLKEILFNSKAKSVIKSIDCEVLCIHSEFKKQTLKKIVLPVSKPISVKKIGIAYELAKKFAARIHLVALRKQEKILNDKGTEALVASYRYLRDNTNIPIECNSVFGKNLAQAAIRYAEVIEADLILIDQGSESDLKLPLGKGNIVNHSSIPVLTVHSIRNGTNKYRA